MNRLVVIAAAATMVLLASCGFQLRGSYELPSHLSPVFLDKESMSLPLYRELTSRIKTSGAVTENADEAASVITVMGENRSRDIRSVDSSGRASEYGLRYTLVFNVKSGGELLIENGSIVRNRTLLFNPDAVLGVANEEQNLYEDMIEDATGSLMMRLQALK
jgi:LPS-assembly lipoprotein